MKVPKLSSGKKSRSSSLAGSSKSSSSRSSSSLSSGAASPASNSCKITPAAEIRKAFPGRPTSASSSAVTRQNSTGKGKGPAENIIEVEEASTSVTARNLEHQELTDAFQLIDVNKDGKISQSELGKVLGSLGYTSSDEELDKNTCVKTLATRHERNHGNEAVAGHVGTRSKLRVVVFNHVRLTCPAFDIGHGVYSSGIKLADMIPEDKRKYGSRPGDYCMPRDRQSTAPTHLIYIQVLTPSDEKLITSSVPKGVSIRKFPELLKEWRDDMLRE